MSKRTRFRQALAVSACGTAAILSVAPANGNDKARVVCSSASKDYKSAEADEQAGRLRSASELYQSCSHATCGGLGQKCNAKYSALIANIPSVVPVVTDEAGEPRVDLQVSVDGEVVKSRLDGRGIAVDPGLHEFTFVNDAGGSATKKVMVIEGERNRPIAVTVHWPTPKTEDKRTPTSAAPEAAPTPAAPPAPESAPPQATRDSVPPTQGRSLVLPLTVGSVGVLALATGGLLTYWGQRDNDALSTCSPNCSASSVGHIRTLYTLSDVSFGVGLAAIGAATGIWLLSSPSKETPQRQASYTFDMGAIRSGAVASVRGTF